MWEDEDDDDEEKKEEEHEDDEEEEEASVGELMVSVWVRQLVFERYIWPAPYCTAWREM